MIIDNISIRMSYESINDVIKEINLMDNIKEIHVSYGSSLEIQCKVGMGLPFLICVDGLSYDGGSISVHVGKMKLFVRLPELIKKSIIKNVIIKFNIQYGGILYDEKDSSIVITRDAYAKLLPFESFGIKSIYAGSEGIEIELIDVDTGKMDVNQHMEDEKPAEIGDSKKLLEGSVDSSNIDMGRVEDYYTKLRSRMERYIKSGVPEKYHCLIPYLLLLPDILSLFIRLFKDKRVSPKDKALVIAGIIYIITPIDIIPDMLLPLGALDDLTMAFFLLDRIIMNTPVEVLKENFEGNKDLIEMMRNGYEQIRTMIPAKSMEKINSLFNKILKKAD